MGAWWTAIENGSGSIGCWREKGRRGYAPRAIRVNLALQGGAFDAETGKEVCTLKGHEGRIQGAFFQPDGKRILFAQQNRFATGTDLLTLELDSGRIAQGVEHRAPGGLL